MTFLGYNKMSKAYLLYDMTSQRVMVSCNVVFYEPLDAFDEGGEIPSASPPIPNFP